MYHVESQPDMWGVTVCVPDDLPLPIGKVDRLVLMKLKISWIQRSTTFVKP